MASVSIDNRYSSTTEGEETASLSLYYWNSNYNDNIDCLSVFWDIELSQKIVIVREPVLLNLLQSISMFYLKCRLLTIFL